MKDILFETLGLLHLPVQQNNEASDHLRKMQARTLIYKAMVASPVLFIGTLAADARFSADPFEFDAATRRQHEAISAYAGPVQKAAALMGRDEPSRETLHQAATIWIKEYREGKLVPLTPAYHGDSVREGVKGQIKNLNDRMVGGLMRSYKDQLSAGNTKAALEDAVMQLELSEVLKYSDAFSVSVAGLQQRAILASLRSNLDKFEPGQRELLLEKLTQIKAKQEPLHEVVRHAQWLYVLDCEKKGIKPLEIEDPSVGGNKRSASAVGANTFNPRLLGERIRNAQNLTDLPTLYSELRMAYTSQEHVIKSLNAVTAKLQSASG